MAIEIQPATPDDAATMVEVGIAAFANDVHQKAVFCFTDGTPEQRAEFIKWRICNIQDRITGPGRHYYKAVDTANGDAIAGFVGIYSPLVNQETPGSTPETAKAPAFANLAARVEFNQKLDAVMREFLGDRKDYWFVKSMAVHPAYQRRGIAESLLRRALEGADAKGEDVYLEQSPAAGSLYKRCGFQRLKQIELHEGAYVMTAMIRHANGRPMHVNGLHSLKQ